MTRPALPMVVAPILAIAGSVAMAAKVETWRQDSAAAFAKGKKEGVVVSDSGRVRLARPLKPTGPIDAAQVWDLARSKASVFAATGNAGKVFRKDGDGPWIPAFDSADSQATAIVALPDGRVFAGTGPTGQVVEISDPKQPSSRPDPGVLYIWDLAADREGALIAATGPTGQLWKRSAEGKWSLLLDSPQAHLLSLAVGPDGSIYAGTDGEGLVYRVGPDGKASILFDAPQAEIRALAFGPDGALYAGTAAESGSGSAAKPAAGGENAVYRIDPEGATREVFRTKGLIFALAWQDDRLLVGTGPEGTLYEVRDLGRESSAVARVDHGQILALLPEPGGEILVGVGDPGAVLRLAADHVASGSILSEVHDAKLPSRFGALRWKAETPPGTTVAVQVRSGNVGEPDPTWSAWSTPKPEGTSTGVGNGRFVQYRATLSTTDPRVSPDLKSVSLHYQTINLAPEIARVEVPDVSAGDGSPRLEKINLRWEATDPNGDDLQYRLFLKKDGWPEWVRLGEAPLTEKTFAWDASAVPGGTYRLRVSATDRPSNPPAEALTRDLTSEPFLIDHRGPVVSIAIRGTSAAIGLQDDLTRIARAAYALDGGDWVPIFPADGIFDSPAESISVGLDDLKPGAHVLMIRTSDAAGNVGTGDAVIRVP